MHPLNWLTQIRLSLSWFYPSSSPPLDVDPETGTGPGPGIPSSPSFISNGLYNHGDHNLTFIIVSSVKLFYKAACLFPRQVYHNLLLLRLPMMYSSRIAGIAGVSGAAANRYDLWETFIDSLLREWKRLNVLSAILTSCVSFPLLFPPFKNNRAEKDVGPF